MPLKTLHRSAWHGFRLVTRGSRAPTRCCYQHSWASAMLQRHAPCRYVITLRYAFLQRYMEVGYSPLYNYY